MAMDAFLKKYDEVGLSSDYVGGQSCYACIIRLCV